jgi:hypothetical protein
VDSRLVFAKTNPISVAPAKPSAALARSFDPQDATCPNPRHRKVQTSKGYEGYADAVQPLSFDTRGNAARQSSGMYVWNEIPNAAIRTRENAREIKNYFCLTYVKAAHFFAWKLRTLFFFLIGPQGQWYLVLEDDDA